MSEPHSLRVGTSAFTANGWRGTFYPEGMRPADYLSYYATKFDTVEVDSTFYGSPKISTVKAWNAKTPPGFIFAAKVPQTITHEKVLVDCDADFNGFIEVMDNLGDKLEPLVFQFGYFNNSVFRGVNDFLARLKPFLKKLPSAHQFAVEIRNKHWLVPQFIDALRERRVARTLIDQSFVGMRAEHWFDKFDPITADFSYVRFLGDRKEIEERTKVWNSVIIDRTKELSEWAEVLGKISNRIPVYTYANNHYAGYAPGTVDEFKAIWNKINSRDRIHIRSSQQIAGEQRRLFE